MSVFFGIEIKKTKRKKKEKKRKGKTKKKKETAGCILVWMDSSEKQCYDRLRSLLGLFSIEKMISIKMRQVCFYLVGFRLRQPCFFSLVDFEHGIMNVNNLFPELTQVEKHVVKTYLTELIDKECIEIESNCLKHVELEQHVVSKFCVVNYINQSYKTKNIIRMILLFDYCVDFKELFQSEDVLTHLRLILIQCQSLRLSDSVFLLNLPVKKTQKIILGMYEKIKSQTSNGVIFSGFNCFNSVVNLTKNTTGEKDVVAICQSVFFLLVFDSVVNLLLHVDVKRETKVIGLKLLSSSFIFLPADYQQKSDCFHPLSSPLTNTGLTVASSLIISICRYMNCHLIRLFGENNWKSANYQLDDFHQFVHIIRLLPFMLTLWDFSKNSPETKTFFFKLFFLFLHPKLKIKIKPNRLIELAASEQTLENDMFNQDIKRFKKYVSNNDKRNVFFENSDPYQRKQVLQTMVSAVFSTILFSETGSETKMRYFEDTFDLNDISDNELLKLAKHTSGPAKERVTKTVNLSEQVVYNKKKIFKWNAHIEKSSLTALFSFLLHISSLECDEEIKFDEIDEGFIDYPCLMVLEWTKKKIDTVQDGSQFFCLHMC